MDATVSQSQRSTSLDQLATAAPTTTNPVTKAPPQQQMQQQGINPNASDSELVKDILQEMQSETNQGSNVQQTTSDEAAINRQMDPNVHNTVMQPETQQDLQAYAQETNKGLELNNQYGQMPDPASLLLKEQHESNAASGWFSKFSVVFKPVMTCSEMFATHSDASGYPWKQLDVFGNREIFVDVPVVFCFSVFLGCV